MKPQITITAKRNLPKAGKFLLVMMVSLFLFSCQKEMVAPETTINNTPAFTPVAASNFHLSESKITLLQGNDKIKAINLSWDVTGSNAGGMFTVEAALKGNNFADFIEIGSTDQLTISPVVKDLNRQLCQLIPAGGTEMVELRVRASNGKTATTYSNPVALQVTTYQHYTEYQAPQYIHVPGNFQSWDMTDAPTLVTTENNGEYDGYVNFTNAYPQFLLVKGTQWTTVNTYTYIGGSKFGFGGGVFSIFGGAGIYRMTASTNTNTFSYTKINTWGVHGTAVSANGNADPEMTYHAATNTWVMNIELAKGDFRIRANNTDAISLGKTMVDGYLVPDYKGTNFTVDKPGNYTITLNLKQAGNYTCSVVKTINPVTGNN